MAILAPHISIVLSKTFPKGYVEHTRDGEIRVLLEKWGCLGHMGSFSKQCPSCDVLATQAAK